MMLSIKKWGFLGGPVAKNPPGNAGEHQFDPWSGKTSQASGHLSPITTTTESKRTTTEACTPRACALQWEAHSSQQRVAPATREIQGSKEDPVQPKKKKGRLTVPLQGEGYSPDTVAKQTSPPVHANVNHPGTWWQGRYWVEKVLQVRERQWLLQVAS